MSRPDYSRAPSSINEIRARAERIAYEKDCHTGRPYVESYDPPTALDILAVFGALDAANLKIANLNEQSLAVIPPSLTDRRK